MIVMKNTDTQDHKNTDPFFELNLRVKDFEMWIKNMNFKLFLEHSHSDDYYKLNRMKVK
jgi:hypothetical protein